MILHKRKRLVLFMTIELVLIIMSTLQPLKLFSQSAKISILKGSNAIFHISTLEQINSGVSLTNWSKIELYFNDPASSGWELTLSADNIALVSSTDSIPLTSLLIELSAPSIIGGSETNLQTNSPSFSPTTGDVWILQGDSKDVKLEFTITYKLGTLAPLLNYDRGYYIVGLSLNLVSKI